MFVEAEQEIERIEQIKKYKYPTFCFDFEQNKKYTKDELMDTNEKIVYYNYLLKEYPKHVIDKMSIIHEKLNDIMLKGNYVEKHFSLLNGINEEYPDVNLLLPVPPQRYEELIAGELKYLNTQLGIELLETKSPKLKSQSNQKFKDEIKNLKEIIQVQSKENTLLTIQETLDYLKIGRTTLYRLIQAQTLHYTMIGKKKYIDRKEIDKKDKISLVGENKNHEKSCRFLCNLRHHCKMLFQ